MTTPVTTVLKRVEFFRDLDDEQLRAVASLCSAVRVTKGQVIFREDTDGDDLFIVYTGTVEIQITTRGSDGQPRQATIHLAYEGHPFGEMALLGGGTRTASAIASTDATLLMINGTDFTQLCERDTVIGYRVMRNLIDDLVYKLRSASLLLRGYVKWRDGQLSQLDQQT